MVIVYNNQFIPFHFTNIKIMMNVVRPSVRPTIVPCTLVYGSWKSSSCRRLCSLNIVVVAFEGGNQGNSCSRSSRNDCRSTRTIKSPPGLKDGFCIAFGLFYRQMQNSEKCAQKVSRCLWLWANVLWHWMFIYDNYFFSIGIGRN